MPILNDRIVDQLDELLPEYINEEGQGLKKFLSAYFDFLEKGILIYDSGVELETIGLEDGEGATKIVELKVEQAFSSQDADRVARGVANSPLVKTAIFAADPNLGRILSAIGACAISRFDENKISVQINEYVVIQNGSLVKGYEEKIARQNMAMKKIKLLISLGVGSASRKLLFCDLSYDYVKINAEYRT